MSKYLLSTCFCLATMVSIQSDAWACNPQRCSGGRVPAVPQVPVSHGPAEPPAVVPPAQPGPVTVRPGSDDVVWDLPAGEKQSIKRAVRAREAAADQPEPVRAAPAKPQADDRLANAVAAHRALAGQLARLMAKRTEIQRWDSAAQEKFRQAFGSTDEQLRQRVLQRIDQQFQEGSRLLATLAESIRFDFYVSRDKK